REPEMAPGAPGTRPSLAGGKTARGLPRNPRGGCVHRLSRAALLLVCFTALGIAASDAAPPDNADPALHGWFESLKQPGSGVSCCSVADCRPVEYRLAADGYEAYLDTRWIHVPDDKIIHGMVNPIARGVLCRSPLSGTIL